MDQLGTLMVAGLGCLLVAYIFDVQGVKTALDGYLGGLDDSARAQGPEVSRYVVLAFPFVAGALALAFLRILGGALVNTLSGLVRGKKKKAKPKPEESAVPAQTLTVAMPVPAAILAAEPVAVVQAPAVCLKPPKPLRPERGVVKVAPAR